MQKLPLKPGPVAETGEWLKAYGELKFLADCLPEEACIRIKQALQIMDASLAQLRASHPEGEKLGQVLRCGYFTGKHCSKLELCEVLGQKLGREIAMSTLYRWQKKAIGAYACILFADPAAPASIRKAMKDMHCMAKRFSGANSGEP